MHGGPQFQLAQQVMNRFAEAIEKSQVDVVPKVSLGGAGGGGSLLDSLLGVLLSEKLSAIAGIAPTTPRDPRAEQLRSDMKKKLGEDKKS